MAFDLSDCQFLGPALPDPFVKSELEKELNKRKLLPKTKGDEGRELKEHWNFFRTKLRALATTGGALRVRNHVIEPLIEVLGFDHLENASEVETREGREAGGILLVSQDGASKLRVWTTSFDEDLYAPARRGRAYRFSHLRIAERVLLASGERLGILTNGVHLVLVISDPARPDSTITIPLDPGWKRSRDVPDSFRLLMALACPEGIEALPELVDKARLQQAHVTKELRVQARQAVERFIQEVIDHPANQDWFTKQNDKQGLAKDLWHEGLIVVYRLLFILKLEASDDPARRFSFASTSLWRNTFSPSIALAPYAQKVLERGAETGNFLESGMRSLFCMFEQGLESTELVVRPLGGALFGPDTTPTLTPLDWGERAIAWLLDRLLWTPKRRGAESRERVHYGPLDVEDLGRVYEALLELEPGISSETMCRLRRQKLEVVVPIAQGQKYRPAEPAEPDETQDTDNADEETDTEEDDTSTRGKKTKVEWIEEIPPGQFYLRVGLGRKASGSYYTPHSFVRFLVQETLGPQVAERSPQDDPNPMEILKLKVLDPAMGSGHFLVQACRFLGEKLYEACRLCDEKASAAERRAEKLAKNKREPALTEAQMWRQRVIDLPDPEDELLQYLPSRSPEGEQSGYSQKRAEALCRRLVATHCLYGVDKNVLAVELAKLSLWLESLSEGLPLTFLDHRLVVGDSLTGPFWHHLIMKPSNPKEPLSNLYTQDLDTSFIKALQHALEDVGELEASVGTTVADIQHKKQVKAKMDRALLPFRVAAAAWSGGVMLGPEKCDDDAYSKLLLTVAKTGDLPERIESKDLQKMVAQGLGMEEVPAEGLALYEIVNSNGSISALSYDLVFPEVFYPTGVPHGRRGFDVVLGNPPWDTIRKNEDHFFGMHDFTFLDPPTKREKKQIKNRLLSSEHVADNFAHYVELLQRRDRINDTLYKSHKAIVKGQLAGRGTYDDYMLFGEKASTLIHKSGFVGFVLPSAFHANEGATGIRDLFLHDLNLRTCFSFENRRKLFEIHSSFKFATVVAEAGHHTNSFSCAFYLHDDEWLFSREDAQKALSYSIEFIEKTGREYYSFLELRSQEDVNVADVCFEDTELFGDYCSQINIKLSQELNMTYDSGRFETNDEVIGKGNDPRKPQILKELISRCYLGLHEGKTFWHYDDQWGEAPIYCVSLVQLEDKPDFVKAARHFRIAFRGIASSTNERTIVFNMLPPGYVFGNSAPSERFPYKVPRSAALKLISIANSYVFDWTARVRTGANVNLFIINACPIPKTKNASMFLSHQALRLCSKHRGYQPLWQEQLGDNWRESDNKPFTWPVLDVDDKWWEVRSAIDAVVADAYGLSREQYVHVLSTFSHSSYPEAPELCLAKFDELEKVGIEAFTKKYDPYWDIPLNENLPKPVIDLPIPGEDSQGEGEFKLTSKPPPKKKRQK